MEAFEDRVILEPPTRLTDLVEPFRENATMDPMDPDREAIELLTDPA